MQSWDLRQTELLSDTESHLCSVELAFSLPSPLRVTEQLSFLQCSPFPALPKTLMEDVT